MHAFQRGRLKASIGMGMCTASGYMPMQPPHEYSCLWLAGKANSQPCAGSRRGSSRSRGTRWQAHAPVCGLALVMVGRQAPVQTTTREAGAGLGSATHATLL